MLQTTDPPAFGKLLRELRVAAGLSQEALAERARISADGVSALERGVNKAPQRETLALLIEALQLRPDQRRAVEAAAARPARPRSPSRAHRRHNLPRLLTPLFGRESDLATVLELISASRVVTLTGAGGVGKTRLAIDAGFAALERFGDGVWFVDLAPVHSAEGVASAIGPVFDVRERPEGLLLDAITEVLARKDALLILDNCEHVAATASAVIEKLVSFCPQIRVLATSRQPLHIGGEQTYRVTSLDSQASVALFEDAARRADASFVLDAADVPIVERITHRLDGIALAIELAAARVKVVSPRQLEDMLTERFRVLTGSGHLARQRTMQAVVDWSYDLLSSEERKLFDRVGVFAADFSFEAVLAICAGEGIDKGDVLGLLAALVDKSLVASERYGRVRRFRLLETMRAYAVEKLGPSIVAYSRRHAEYYAELVQSAKFSQNTAAMTFETEYDNLRQALSWTIDDGNDVALGVRLLAASGSFLLLRGLVAEAARRAERALAHSAELAPELEALAWETLAAMRGDLLLPAACFDAAKRALELYEQLDDRVGVARVLRVRGVARLRFGEFAEGQADLQRALELAKAAGDRHNWVRILGAVAMGYEMSGRPVEGRDVNLQVLEMARADGDEVLVSLSLMNLAEAEFALGETTAAVARLEEFLAAGFERKNVRMRANVESNLAAYLIALQRNDEAHSIARTAVFDARAAGDEGIMACAIGHLAALLAPRDPRGAAKLLGYVGRIFTGGYKREHTESFTHEILVAALHDRLNDDEIAALAQEGVGMSETQAVRLATRAR